MGVDLGSERGGRRVDRAVGAVDQARREIVGWIGARRDDPRFVRFGPQLRVLDVVLVEMLTALDERLRALGTSPERGDTYDGCRAVEVMLTVVRRTFSWYRDRYDQRLDPRLGPVLLAADELVRSCWTQPFRTLRRTPGQGPLAYVDPRFNAFAVARSAVPPELRLPARTDAVDASVRELRRELPIATIALPEWATREVWWLALAAHEAGHLLVRELDGVREPDGVRELGGVRQLGGVRELGGARGADGGIGAVTRSAVLAAVRAADGGRAELAEQWSGWHGELFADAFSAVMLADAAAWTVDELEHGGPKRLIAQATAGYPYPPPLVRRALLGEIARRVRAVDPARPSVASVGVASAGVASVGVAEGEAWLAGAHVGGAEELRRHLAVVPAVADALLALPVGGRTLVELGAVDQAWYGPHGRVTNWAAALRRDPVPISAAALRTRPAARLAVQAGVAAQLTMPAAELAELHDRLVTVLRAAGPEGTLAAPPARPGDLDLLAARLTRRLLDGTLPADGTLPTEGALPAADVLAAAVGPSAREREGR